MMLSSAWQGLLCTLLLVSTPAHAASSIEYTDVQSCSCGFYDESADLFFTESTIVYFNETGTTIPSDYVVEEFAHHYDIGWNNMYRKGAAVDNVNIVIDATARNLTSLQMACEPSDHEHLVVGSSIRTARQDIFFGSFRSTLRPARNYTRGSVISMLLAHNQSESWQVDVMNTDNSSQAWVDMLMQGQFANTWFGANFTNLTQEGMEPWYYTEYRVDWTREGLNYSIGGDLKMNFNKSVNSTIPSTPAPLTFQHWSLGNKYTSQGPPDIVNLANIGYTRLFFNSSTWNDTYRKAYDDRCSVQDACSMDDFTLRGNSSYTAESLKAWKQHQPPYRIKWVPLTMDIVFGAIFLILTTKTLWRRFTWNKFLVFLHIREPEPPKPKAFSPPEPAPSTDGSSDGVRDYSGDTTPHASGGADISRNASFNTLPPYRGTQTPLPQYQSPSVSRRPSLSNIAGHNSNFSASLSGTVQGESSGAASLYAVPHLEQSSHTSAQFDTSNISTEVTTVSESVVNGTRIEYSTETRTEGQTLVNTQAAGAEKAEAGKDGKNAKPAAAASAKPPRIDYLAGFISISSLLVTANHFGLTYFSAAIEPGSSPHYHSEIVARMTFATYFLDPLWIGPFLMISTRFLTSNYIRTGNLNNMAQKIVARPFRLLTPVASIALLEYFFMDAGALDWLQSLPSVTWSDWPFVAIPANPGIYVSEILQLAFLIPNAAPMITNNYCTGVLWTIPVQLQGAWQTLLGLIMIRQIKNPYKRFGFYLFCIIMHRYALSWGSYYYVGTMLADLDITYKYKQWVQPRAWAYWPLLIFLSCVAIAGFSMDLITQHNGVNYAEIEYGWHPDTATGLSILQANADSYPDYFIPRLNAFLSTITMQAVVEICPTLQKVLSVKVLQWLFPHIFSVYLIHGFIIWSVGSWTMLSMWSMGYPYWLCTLITAITSYGTLFASLPFLTPPIEALGKGFTVRLWQFASTEPVPRKPTTYPFGKELLTRRHELQTPSPSPSLKASSVTNEKSKETQTHVKELKSEKIMEHINEF
jgi:Glycosyl hydrolases family 16